VGKFLLEGEKVQPPRAQRRPDSKAGEKGGKDQKSLPIVKRREKTTTSGGVPLLNPKTEKGISKY